ncbi:acyl-CoA dehydrogenase family protein [Candidatus Poriferisocius sp.]|uniref:acyl-CoA dehydrogenase family protein n=1 Tax=Candidatus Poriferisocius sp. TaxID=3101276 RepID=UPI003B5AE7D4
MTVTLDEFRRRAADFLAANAVARDEPPVEWSETERVAECRRFHGALADAGLGGITYPVEYGGQGLDKSYLEAFNRELSGYQAPLLPVTISHGMCLPVINDFGTPEQRARHQARIIRADEIWCQMFSEPGAGSDVASLATRAVRDGDQWVLNGQKVWTSGAQYCDFGLCVARTDPSQPKHRGLSMFIVDLSLPGVDIRPLRQMNGSSHFNEIYLTDVQVGHDCLVGGEGQGWNVAVAMLMYERVAIGAADNGAMGSRMGSTLLIDEARRRGLHTDAVTRDALADLYIRERVQSFIGMRIRQAAAQGRAPGPEGSIAKLNAAILSRRTADVAIGLTGASGQAWEAGDDDAGQWADGVVGAPGMGIAGGTNEVQRNIIGERVLGLPKEPDPYKGQPWEAIPRS